MAKLLRAFEIGPGRDENGQTITPDLDPVTGYSDGFFLCAKDFKAEFWVRGTQRREIILAEVGKPERELFARYAPEGSDGA